MILKAIASPNLIYWCYMTACQKGLCAADVLSYRVHVCGLAGPRAVCPLGQEQCCYIIVAQPGPILPKATTVPLCTYMCLCLLSPCLYAL